MSKTNGPGPLVRVQAEAFDIGRESDAVAGRAGAIGAIVSFTGLCRDEDGRLTALEIEHYPGMAEAQIKRIADQAWACWPLQALRVVHRHGRIEPDEPIVLVIAASAHRRAAFEAAEFLMDYLKTDAPFWKREHLADGSVGDWVDAADADETAKDRWSAKA